jgi:putative ABC transport system substrate-binding protein
VLANPLTVRRDLLEPDMRRLGQQLGLPIQIVEASGPEQFDAVFAALQREGADGLLVLADSVFYSHRIRLGELVAKQRLPSVWGHRTYLDAGGLASYQSDVPTMFRSGAAQVDKILRGAKPGEIPFEQATKLELVLNLKAARALGLTVPPAVRLLADEVLE